VTKQGYLWEIAQCCNTDGKEALFKGYDIMGVCPAKMVSCPSKNDLTRQLNWCPAGKYFKPHHMIRFAWFQFRTQANLLVVKSSR